MPRLIRRRCVTCLKFFGASKKTQLFCSKRCLPSGPVAYHVCVQCQTPFVLPKACDRGAPFCSDFCRHTKKSVPIEREQPQDNATSWAYYDRDTELFAQRRSYTQGQTTWLATPCCYCGAPAQDEEHVLPISAFRALSAVGSGILTRDILRIVPACHECNIVASDKVFTSFDDKRLYIKAALRQRYSHILDYPAWRTVELAGLTGHLRQWIAKGQATREALQARIDF